MIPNTTRVSRTAPLSQADRLPRSRASRSGRSVEEMLQDISLVLWLTRKMKEEILAEAAPVRGGMVSADDATTDLAACV